MVETGRPSRSLRFGIFEVDLEAGELRKRGIRVKLQEQPFHILLLLLEHPGKLITREELCRILWAGHTFVDFDRNLNKAMTKLRGALGDSAENPRFIETLHRRGYRFIAPIVAQNHDADEEANTAALPILPAAGKEVAAAYVEEDRRQHHPVVRPTLKPGALYLGGALLAALMFGAAVFYLSSHSAVVKGNSIPVTTPRRSVAVLGFKSLSGRPDEAWISTALAEWLMTDLSEGGQLRIIPPDNVVQLRAELSPLNIGRLNRESLTRIGKNLDTDLVVVGSYASLDQGSSSPVRLDLRLQDTRTGETVAAVSESGTKTHLFELISRAGEELRAKLGIRAVSGKEAAEVAASLPSNLEAMRLYSQGLARLRVFDALGARDVFQQAIAAEPSYALSHSALAAAWAMLGNHGMAKSESKRAFDLSSNLPRADRLLVEARYHEMSGDWDKAIEIYRALFEFFPDDVDYGLALARTQSSGGRGKEALETVSTLRQLPFGEDPRIDLEDARGAESLGNFKRDLASATRAADKARGMGASTLLAHAREDQAWAFANLGRSDKAAIAVNEAQQLFAAAGDQKGVAEARSLSGVVLDNQGDAMGAKARYEESLALYRQIGDKLGVANELDNLGDELLALGDLEGARREYDKSMATYREIGHENGVCLTKGALGPVLLALGDSSGSISTSQQSVAICQQLGDRNKAAIALASLGKTLRIEGRATEARKDESEAVSTFEDIGDKQQAARSRGAIAELLLDEGKTVEAAEIARQAVDEFKSENAARDEAVADTILSQALLKQGNTVDARRAIDEARTDLSRSHDCEAELMVAIAAARVQAASSGPVNAKRAATDLREIARQASSIRWVPYELEARLALAEIEVDSDDRVNGRTLLEALHKEAIDRGLGLIAVEAEKDLTNSVRAKPDRESRQVTLAFSTNAAGASVIATR